MTSAKWFGGILLAIAAGLAPQLAAQLRTDVPPPVAGTKPVTVGRDAAQSSSLYPDEQPEKIAELIERYAVQP